ncbi:MAG: HAD-IC family P-type ATPase [Bradymonadaceae bacterium]|nr:HAD-IC family P-type ATPase [Lujinxingiaceae bacterium]
MTDSPLAAQKLPDQDQPWHTLAADEVLAHHALDPSSGLSQTEATRRLAHYGPNRLQTSEGPRWWRLLLKQFLDPLIYILIASALVALFFGKYIDTAVIAAVLIINASIGFVQELRARRAIAALAQMAAPRAEVLRDGHSDEISSQDVVPGDLVQLRAGARVPADVRLIEANELELDESALTGESVPTPKSVSPLDQAELVPGDQFNMAFSTTIVTRGRGRGVVVRTGTHSEIGKIAAAVSEIEDTRAPVQHKVETLGKWIGAAVGALTVVVTLTGILQGRGVDDIVSMVIALAVAAIPEALPVVLTVTLAVGVRRMAEKNAIIRSLPAVETLGSTTLIGSDKTGTLTRNEMTVRALWTGAERFELDGGGYHTEGSITLAGQPASPGEHRALELTLLIGVLANEVDHLPSEQHPASGDPTELALLVAATKAGIDIEEVRARHPERELIPFESERQFMASLHALADGPAALVKGSPEAVLAICTHQIGPDGERLSLDSAAVVDNARRLASEGLRVLAMAYRPDTQAGLEQALASKDFVFVGLQAMEDPVRPEAIEAVAAARDAGIRVIMLTGDHLETAQAIGHQLGLGERNARAIEGRKLAQLDAHALDQTVREVDIYARVAPEHKLAIVEQLKRQGHIVAVTGDGVNDAPALRAAHLGVAMGKSGTDVAREASDMVLSDDNFATLAAAVEQGRVVFANIRKVTYFLLSTGVGLVLTILFALFAGWPLPYLAAQVLWINLVTKGLQDVALAFEPGEPGLLEVPPRDPDEGVLNRPVLVRMLTIGLYLAAVTLAVFWWALQSTGDLVLARSIAMTQMVLFQFFHVGNCRSLHRSIFTLSLTSNRFLFLSVLAALLAQIAILYVPALQFVFQTAPLALEHWVIITLISTTIIAVAELDKWWLRHRGLGPGLAPQKPVHNAITTR